MKKLYALDLFCGAGGVSKGLADAGYEITGVDLVAQPNYPFRFIQADATKFNLEGFDFVWASPPCQAFTAYKRRPDHVKAVPNLIPIMRKRLSGVCVPTVIENVPGAPLKNPITLCGSMFGLDVRRHRCFETSFPVVELECNHTSNPRFAPATNRKNKRSTVEIGVWRIPLEVQQKAMGIDWMTLPELSQAIPPAYSEYLARAAQ